MVIIMKYYKIIYQNESFGDLVVGIVKNKLLAKDILDANPLMNYKIEVIEGDIHLLSDL